MKALVRLLLRYRALVLIALAAWIAAGIYAFLQLDIEAYPDPSPPLVELITQNPSWSAEEIEQQITVPVETVLNGMPRLEYIRSISIFGLSDIKLYFSFDSDYFYDRQEVLNRLQTIALPNGLSPQLSPWSPIGEIYRYRLEGPAYTLNQITAEQNWTVRRELKQVPGIIDITTFGGATKQYQVEVDPQRLLQYNITLPQALTALNSANANAGGNYLSLGSQNVNVRGIGLLKNLEDISSVVITQRNGVPVLLRDIAQVREGYQSRLGQVGVNKLNDVVQGIVLLQRGEQSLPALGALRKKIEELNHGLLPPGMHIKPLYDRTDLIGLTTHTVRHIVITGLVLLTVLLLVMLGDVRFTLITALTIPVSILFAFGLMVLTGRSANLISIGAIDFGILVDAAIVVLESIFRRLQSRLEHESVFEVIVHATAQSSRAVLFSTLIILVAFIPLFTMHGVPGKIFAPMSITYGFALTGALMFALLFAPVLASYERPQGQSALRETRVAAWFRRHYERSLDWSLARPKWTAIIAFASLLGAVLVLPFVGGEFMPALEEGNLWIRATLPQDISFEQSSAIADKLRETLSQFPEVRQLVSQVGRPDDGTDPSTFNNIEISVALLPQSRWPGHIDKEELIHQMDERLEKFPGIAFNFSQNIQDNVEEAMSGVKGENSLKLFGDNIDTLASKASEIQKVMESVPGVSDVGVFRVTGQPDLLISIDRARAARYGVMAADVNGVVQAAIGGSAATQILEGDRRFDLVVRYLPQYRNTPEQIRNLLVPTSDGSKVPLASVANVELREGSFMIYRENNRRYIPIKFSVRGRDLATTIRELQEKLQRQVQLPNGYKYEWAGEYDSLQKELHRLAIIIPISILIILVLLYVSFHNWRDALIVLAVLPFGAVGGVLSLFLTGTPFSISAAVGFTSVLGVGTLGAVVFLSGVRRNQREEGWQAGIRDGSVEEMRPVLMACLAAGLGLLPAALSSGIGAQAQQPLARVVVGGMITTIPAITFLLPLLSGFAPHGLDRPQDEQSHDMEEIHESELNRQG